MFWKKKKKTDKGLPDLPPLGNIVKPPKLQQNSFPEFPDSPKKSEEFSYTHTPELPEIPGHEKKFKTMEINEPFIGNNVPIQKIKPLPKMPESYSTIESKRPNERMFVKLDKFHSAKKTLSQIQEKLTEIDSLLGKIRETKMREEQELASWEREVESAKSRIQNIMDNIFSGEK